MSWIPCRRRGPQSDQAALETPPTSAPSPNAHTDALLSSLAQAMRTQGRTPTQPQLPMNVDTLLSAEPDTAPAANITAAISNTQSSVTKQTYFITISTPTGPMKFKIEATYPIGLTPKNVEEFWKKKLQFLAQTNHHALPQPQETQQMCVFGNNDGLEVTKNGTPYQVKDPKIAASCHAYVNGQDTALAEALKQENFEPVPAASATHYPKPAVIEHTTNTCYLASALQVLANDPVLLRELYRPRDSTSSDLAAIRNVVERYRSYQSQGKAIPAAEMTQFRDILAQIVQKRKSGPQAENLATSNTQPKDAGEVFGLLKALILDGSQSPAFQTTLQLKSGQTHPLACDPNFGILSLAPDKDSPQISDLLFNACSTNDPTTIQQRYGQIASVNPSQIKTATSQFDAPPEQLDLTFGDHLAIPVIAKATLSLPAGLFSRDGEDQKYHLSSAIFHAPTHFTSLIAKSGPNGNPVYYHCDDLKKENTLIGDEAACNTFLAANADKLCRVIYNREDVASQASSAPSAPPLDKSESAPSAPPLDALPKNGMTGRVDTQWGHEAGYTNGKYQPALRLYIDDAFTKPDDFHLVQFTDETMTQDMLSYTDRRANNLSEKERAAAKTDLARNRVFGSLLKRDQLTTGSTFITTDRSIYINHGGTLKGFRDALEAALDKAYESRGKSGRGIKIAIPLPDIVNTGPAQAFDVITKVISNFEGSKKCQDQRIVEIRVVMTEQQAKMILGQVHIAKPSSANPSSDTDSSEPVLAPGPAPAPPEDLSSQYVKPYYYPIVPSGYTPVRLSIRQYYESDPSFDKDTHVVELDSSYIPTNEADTSKISRETFPHQFNKYAQEAINTRRRKLVIKIPKDLHGQKPLATKARFERCIENLTALKDYTDGNLTSVEVAFVPEPSRSTGSKTAAENGG